MKIAITAKGEWINSTFCPNFEQCEYIIIYDTVTKQYGSRKSPSFQTKNRDTLIDFFRKTFIKNIITGISFETNKLNIFIPSSNNITVEEAIMEFLEG